MKLELVPRHPAIEGFSQLVMLVLASLAMYAYVFPSSEDRPVLLLIGGFVLWFIIGFGYIFSVRRMTFLDEKVVIYRAVLKQEILYKDVTDIDRTVIRSQRAYCSLGNITNRADFDQVIAHLFESGRITRQQLVGRLAPSRRRMLTYAILFGAGGYLLSWIAVWAGWLKGIPPELVGPLQVAFIATAAGISQVYSNR